MSDKNFVNYHILISHNSSCLNRDDMGMQKTAVFGGTRRVRISSQSLKREMRKPRLEEHANNYWKQHFGEPSIRTRDLTKLNEKFIKELGDEFESAFVTEAIDRFVKTAKSTANEVEEDTVDEEGDDSAEKSEAKKTAKKIAVAPWVVNEIREICRVIKAVKEEGLSDDELKKIDESFNKQKKKKKSKEELIDEAIGKKIEKQLKEKAEAVKNALASAVDIALFGRMATSGLMTSVDGAMAMAHSITTHTVDGDIDWFTAVDDLIQDSGETGSGHLDTQEFSAGVFYRYASLNLSLLQRNLGVDRAGALDIAKHFLHLLATTIPSAKQNSFAAFNPTDFACVSLSDMPISLANAFEEPVSRGKNGGFRKPSISAFCDYKQRIYDGYDLQDAVGFFSIEDCTLQDKRMKTLVELEQWLQNNGKA
ncbi:type I-E CRISPR-associated protein Cas7/Cse4/CasC [Methylobacter tundripaludum]|uniref:CRISPR-associated protein, Cse4 family n=1 Tax=Methylobacter tundripaludum (strain ATCC BAA-1195 / DSM 17260 / SV96) TaxID=697282 RepID=G3IX73_METTV|nr:type I-E CRISPR-associated protein Cas7/Cse4/CasC [Methylobacter tundripaludum]EGW22010.1 CRISPR-associated protein, Cse4 family [Methylobacter tundripaludum SV96]